MPTTFTFLTFEQWKEQNTDLFEVKEDCDECNGSGSHECECGDVHDCGFCQGTGKVVDVTLSDMYRSARARDESRLEKWLERNRAAEHPLQADVATESVKCVGAATDIPCQSGSLSEPPRS